MDAFHAARSGNYLALKGYVETLYCGEQSSRPVPLPVPSVDDPEMRYMLALDEEESDEVATLLTNGTDEECIKAILFEWTVTCKRAMEYRIYNRRALKKRHAKGSSQAEIDRVQKLIDDGTQEIEYLIPRVSWATARLGVKA